MVMKRVAIGGGISIVAMLAGLPAAYGQTSAMADSNRDAETQVGDIIVTAQKRAQSLSDVGLTVTALSGDTLAQRGIGNIADLVNAVPGLTVALTPIGPPVYSLRGVGFYDSSLAASPAVSVYVDEVPLPFPAMTLGAGLDVARVEVLKGPQGTLFGQNSTGGAINYVAAKPTEDFQGQVEASYGRFDRFEGKGFVSVPLTNTLAARLSFRTLQSGDWQKNFTRKDSLGEQHLTMARLLLEWKPTDRLSATLNANGWIDKSDTQAGQYSAFRPQSPASVLPEAAAYPLAPKNARAADWNPDLDYSRDNSFFQLAARVDYEATDDLTFTSITSYVDYKRNETIEGGGTALRDNDRLPKGSVKSFNQELRIANATTNPLRFVLGVNYERDKSRDSTVNLLGDTSSRNATGLFLDHVIFFGNQSIDTYAAFGNLEYDLLRNLTVKAGVRYTDQKRAFAGCSADTGDGQAAAAFTALWRRFRPSFQEIAPNGCITLVDTQNVVAGQIDSVLKEDNVSWRAGVDFKATPTVLLYANVSRGYKSGSFPTASASTFRQYLPVAQETVLAYEAGFKAQVFDRTVSINGAAFYYNYRDKQIRGRISDPVFNSLEALVNVPRSRVQGGEIELAVRPVSGLDMSFTATYIDAQIKKFTGFTTKNVVADLAGSPMPYTPKWQIAASADYRFPVTGGLDAFLGGSVSHHTRSYASIGIDPDYLIKDYIVVDLRAGIETHDGVWRASVYGKNVTNSYYWNNASRSFDTLTRYTAMPATYGITLSRRF